MNNSEYYYMHLLDKYKKRLSMVINFKQTSSILLFISLVLNFISVRSFAKQINLVMLIVFSISVIAEHAIKGKIRKIRHQSFLASLKHFED